jgi:tRNA modification GTPase
VGEGGIGVVRLSGDDAVAIADRIFRASKGNAVREFQTHSIHLGVVRDPSTGERLDEAMLAVMRAPRTYTRLDTVEVYCHGSALMSRRILDLLVRQGARLAEPGEFTKWAFLNGRIDLTQAEAVMDLIRAKTEATQRAAMAQMDGILHHRITALHQETIRLLAEIEAGMDFPEEDLQFLTGDQIQTQIQALVEKVDSLLRTAETGRALRDGIATAIIGRPNVGKSSLLNALLMCNRAIVTPVPGTTRDTIEEYLNLQGVPVRIIDTAGLRDTDDLIEREGVSRTRRIIQQADLIVLVLDLTQEMGPGEQSLLDETRGKRCLIVLNKMDLITDPLRARRLADELKDPSKPIITVSAATGAGLDDLREAMLDQIRTGLVMSGDREAIINSRHKALLLDTKKCFTNAASSGVQKAQNELIALDLRAAIERLGEITGTTATEDLLEQIFKEFCIGK